MRKISKKSKKGYLEKIYKEYTLPLVLKKNGGICVCCNKNSADGGHHIFGREKSYYHIHPDFIVPVCNWCHSFEKSTKIEDRDKFDKNTLSFFSKQQDKEENAKFLEEWADYKLMEYGYKWGGI